MKKEASSALEMLQFHARAYPRLQENALDEIGHEAAKMAASTLRGDAAAIFASFDGRPIALTGCHGFAADPGTAEDAQREFVQFLLEQPVGVVRLEDLAPKHAAVAASWGLQTFAVAPILGEDTGREGLCGCLLVCADLSESDGIAALETLAAMISAAYVACLDRRDMKDVHEVLKEAKHLADAADRAKTDFLANMSHELRTPLTSIIGYADLLTEKLGGCDELEFVKTIHRNGNLLLERLSEILELSRFEFGRSEISLERVDTAALATAALADVRSAAKEKGLALSLSYDGMLPVTFLSDGSYVRRILGHLLGNAVKFTETGGVQLRVFLLPEEPNKPTRIGFEVRDTGIGMSAKVREQLFTPFYQADGTVTREHGGAGLGLITSKKMALLLGGDIEVVSKKGKGSRFTVIVSTGDLSNVTMLAGAELLEQETAPRKAAPPAATGTSTEPKVAPSAARPLDGTRVLLVEDGRDNQMLLSMILRKNGAQVAVSENGQLGRDTALAAQAANDPFDVILMDMQMPVMDGYTATRELREQGYDGPIIALTAHALAGDREKCLEAGCNDFGTKPVNKEELIDKIGHQLKQFAEGAAN